MTISLRVLGGRELIGPDGRTLHTLLVQPKRFALLVYLLTDRPFRQHQRDELLALFWPEYPDENARSALSQALTFIRRSLGEGVVVTQGTDLVGVDRDRFSCDVLAFDDAISRGDPAAALELYQRDLLDGFHVDDAPQFAQWLESERTYLRGRAVASARALSTQRAASGNADDALRCARRGAEIAPDDEGLALQLIRLHERMGQRAEALRAYAEYEARVAELRLVPSVELRELVRRIRDGGAARTSDVTRDERDTHPDAPRVTMTDAPASAQVNAQANAKIRPRWERVPRRTTMGWVAALLVIAVAVTIGARRWLPTAASPMPHARFAITLDDSVRLRSELSGVTIALSPDASRFVFVGGTAPERLYMRTLDQMSPRAIEGSERATNPVFSPDGKWLAFVENGRLKRVPTSGGSVTPICDSVIRFTWSERDLIVYSGGSLSTRRSSLLWSVSAAGGPRTQLTQLDSTRGETQHTWPSFLPGGEAVLFETRAGGLETAELAVLRLSDRQVLHLGIQGSNPHYLSSGHILFGRFGNGVSAIPFDATRLKITGPAVPVLEDVVVKSGGATELAIAANGALVYVPESPPRELVLVDRKGGARSLYPEPQDFSNPRMSPDGKQVAVAIGSSGQSDIFIYDIARGTRRRLTSQSMSNRPTWTKDGQRVSWHARDSTGHRMVWQRADGRGPSETIADSAPGGVTSPTGDFFLATRDPFGAFAIGAELVRFDSPHQRVALTRDDTRQMRVSPDGRWLAYTVGESHHRDVFVRAIPGPDGAHQISVGGGTEPVWSQSGRELFYRANGKLLSVTLTTTPQLSVVRRDTLFTDDFWSTPNNNSFADYDVAPDGQHFVFLRGTGTPANPIIIFGFPDELWQKVALSRKQ